MGEEDDEEEVSGSGSLPPPADEDMDEGGRPEKGEKHESSEAYGVANPRIEAVDEEEINVGDEHIKMVEARYCNLCFTYISHRGDPEVNFKRHCASEHHIRLYIRYKDDIMLREEAAAVRRETEKKKQEAAEKKAKEAAEKKAQEEAEKLNEPTSTGVDEVKPINLS